MRTFVVITNDLVYCPGSDPSICTLDEVADFVNPSEPLLFAIVPFAVARVLGTDRTIDAVVSQQYPGSYSFQTEPLETNVFQVYVAHDELLARLRAMSRDVSIVPYPAAVRSVVSSMQGELGTSLRERTRVFIQSLTSDVTKAPPPERLAIDCIDEDYLITAIRGQEVVAVRLVRGGDPIIEAQRTIAGNRLENPLVLTRDNDLAMEFKVQGFTAEYADVDGELIGLAGADKVLSLRFRTEFELAREKARESRRRSLLYLFLSLVVFGGSAAGFVYTRASQAMAESQTALLTSQRDGLAAQLAEINQERYAAMARSESVFLSEELFDLSISLPPQVALVSLQKDATGLVASMERRPGAAPFARADLTAALSTSPFFSRAQIKEEFEGHIVRYNLTVPSTPTEAQP
ncbi:MAG TPA: hypothetical protein DFS52_08795 [Myxococcales bacterium]|jgi:Tfp pilus assembly protein PilN|nr:hypothetical protein [Myxococcales bacterium]